MPINGALPSVSPDGRQIAFSARRDVTKPGEILVINADGTGERRVGTGSGMPHWVNRGTKLFYVGPNGPVETSIDGAEPKPASMPGSGRGFAPSPDGRSVTYSAGAPPDMQLMVSTIEGMNPRAVVSGQGMVFNGTWSPDGKRIAYARSDSMRDMQMWLVNADGTGRKQITRFSGADGHPQWPSWSPDGKWIAVQSGVYSQDRATNTAHIWLINVETGEAKKLASHDRPYLDETPSFFPDGKRIAFQSDRTGRMEVWVMNVDGTEARQVTR
jgi:TolB protein